MFCDSLPVHTSCYYSACCLYAELLGFLAQPVRKSDKVNLAKCLNLCWDWGVDLHSGVLDTLQEWQTIVGGSSCVGISVDRSIKDKWAILDDVKRFTKGNGQ